MARLLHIDGCGGVDNDHSHLKTPPGGLSPRAAGHLHYRFNRSLQLPTFLSPGYPGGDDRTLTPTGVTGTLFQDAWISCDRDVVVDLDLGHLVNTP